MAGERMVISEYLGCGQFERIVRSAGFFCILKGETMRERRRQKTKLASVQRLATAHASQRQNNRRHTKR
jgi:hypothetical protein